MNVEVEPSGCYQRKGLVQIRFAMYLDKGDYGYATHHIQMPVIPPEGYLGELDVWGAPANTEDYNNWLATLPKTWQTNPFHNHFIYVEPDTTDEEIINIGKKLLHDFYIMWVRHEKLNQKNPPPNFHIPANSNQLKAVEDKVKHLREAILQGRP